MTPQQLKNSILQLATQGKLVEQRPEEGTAEALYRDIQAEKARLVNAGKIKKDKPLPEIANDELPFDIPESWKWVRLRDISEVIVDCPHSTPHYYENPTGYNAIDTNCIDENGNITKWRYVDGDTYGERVLRLVPQVGDIVYTREGSICRAAILPDGYKVCLGQRVMLIRVSKCMRGEFIRKLLMSPQIVSALTAQQKGIGAKHVNVKDVVSLKLPLPPLAEQKRIVARIEELLPLVDRYEQAWTQLQALDQRFPADLQKSILQLAIQGRLVEQRPEEGTAEALYRDIQAEKSALHAKPNKKIDPITEDSILFDIPESWQWVRFGDIVRYNMGKTPPRAEVQWWAQDFPWVSISDMPESGHIVSTREKVSRAALSEKFSNRVSPAGTLLMSFKLTIGRVSILDIDAVHNEAIISIYPYCDNEGTLKSYLFLVLPYITQFGESKNAIKGKTLNDTSISNLLIPLPPLAEQKRIVARIEELLPLCEALKHRVS